MIRMNLVKDIDIYRLAHHGIAGYNSKAMLDEANPKCIVQTGYLGKLMPMPTRAQINQKVGSKFYSTSSYRIIVLLLLYLLLIGIRDYLKRIYPNDHFIPVFVANDR